MRNVSCPKIDGLTQEKGNEFSSMLTNLPFHKQGCITENVGNRNKRNSLEHEVRKIDLPDGLQSTLLNRLNETLRTFGALYFGHI